MTIPPNLANNKFDVNSANDIDSKEWMKKKEVQICIKNWNLKKTNYTPRLVIRPITANLHYK